MTYAPTPPGQYGPCGTGVFCVVGDVEAYNNDPLSNWTTATNESPSIRLDGSAGELEIGVGDTTEPTWILGYLSANVAVIGAGDSLAWEGTTADAFETTVSGADVTADVTISMPLSNAADSSFFVSTLTTNSPQVVNSIWGASNQMEFEGATADGFETFLTPVDATADRTVTLPDQTGTVQLVDNLVAASGTLTLTAALYTGATIAFDTAAGSVVTLPAATGTGDCYNFIVSVTVTSNVHSLVVADATDEFVGNIDMAEDGANPGLVWSAADGSDNDNVDMNGTTTGGDIGDRITICDILTDNWAIWGTVNGTGTEATPFVTGAVS